jgi:hypothetical protein
MRADTALNDRASTTHSLSAASAFRSLVVELPVRGCAREEELAVVILVLR